MEPAWEAEQDWPTNEKETEQSGVLEAEKRRDRSRCEIMSVTPSSSVTFDLYHKPSAVSSDRTTVFTLEIKNSFERLNDCSQETCLIRGPSEYMVPDPGPLRKHCSCPVFFFPPIGLYYSSVLRPMTRLTLCASTKTDAGFL